MLKAKNLCWQQGNKKILDNIDFSLLKGEVIGLVGPNGSGKSSLLKVLSFLEKPTSGEILFQNKIIGSNISLDIRRKIAIVFQDPLLLNTTVYENVASGLKIRGKSKKEISDKVDRWLTSFGISHLKNQKARLLSGGESQRVSLARAFAIEPDVIFLDEPFSALDVPTKELLIDDINKIIKDTNTTAVVVSHDFRDIFRLASKAMVLINGRVEAVDTPFNLINKSTTAEVDRFLIHWKNLNF